MGRLSNIHERLRHFTYTIFLFTQDQFLDVILPGTAFSLCTALNPSTFNLPPQNRWHVARRTPHIVLWLFLQVLQFTLHNQSSAAAVEEDRVNKPWRPIPAQRITRRQTRYCVPGSWAMAVAVSYKLGVLPYFAMHVPLSVLYHDVGLDGNAVSKNVLCGMGYACYLGGALRIALGNDLTFESRAWSWVLIMALGVLATTIQVQDMRDEAGDRIKGRKTLVILVGRRATILTSVLVVIWWSVYIPVGFLRGGWLVAVLPMVLGTTLASMLVHGLNKERIRKDWDKRMIEIWVLWMMGFFALPAWQASWL